MNLSQAHHVSKWPGGQPLVRGKNLSSPIVCRVTEIVNQPFPSKGHALTGRVNRQSGVKGKLGYHATLAQYKDVGLSRQSSSGFTLGARLRGKSGRVLI